MLNLRVNSRFSPGVRFTRHAILPFSSRMIFFLLETQQFYHNSFVARLRRRFPKHDKLRRGLVVGVCHEELVSDSMGLVG